MPTPGEVGPHFPDRASAAFEHGVKRRYPARPAPPSRARPASRGGKSLPDHRELGDASAQLQVADHGNVLDRGTEAAIGEGCNAGREGTTRAHRSSWSCRR